MAKPPPRTDEEIAKAAMLDIAGSLGSTLPEYDQRYIFQRILWAIREAKGTWIVILVSRRKRLMAA